MTSYTMNGHRHPTIQIRPDIPAGMVGNGVARSARERCQMRVLPEQINGRETPNPRIELQEALKQIENLLKENLVLLETARLLAEALDHSPSSIHEDPVIELPARDSERLSENARGYLEQLSSKIRMNVLE